MADIDQIKAEVLQALAQQHTAAHFACSGPVSDAPTPGLIINGLGVIGFPLSGREAQVVISKCRKSPVGKGTETLLDDSIRKSYELNPSHFGIVNPALVFWSLVCRRHIQAAKSSSRTTRLNTSLTAQSAPIR